MYAVTITNYLQGSKIEVVVELIFGLILGVVARYSVQQDLTVHQLSKKFLAVVGIYYYPITSCTRPFFFFEFLISYSFVF